MRAVLTIVVCSVLSLAESAFCQPNKSLAADKEIDELISNLASNQFKIREQAQRLLLQREDAVPALRRALRSDDKELAQRAAAILEGQQRLDVERAIEKLRSLAKQGYCDQVVERLVARQDWGGQEDAAFQVISDITGKLLDIETKLLGQLRLDKPQRRGPPYPPDYDSRAEMPFRDFLRYKKYTNPTFVVEGSPVPVNGLMAFRGGDVTANDVLGSSVVCSTGGVRAGEVVKSAIFAGTSVVAKKIYTSVVVCDGDVTVEENRGEGMGGCIIIARGKITCPYPTHMSLISSSAAVEVRQRRFDGCLIKEKQSLHFDFVRFFETEHAGIEVLAQAKGVKVKAVAAKQRFALAGVKPDDVLLALDQSEVTSTEQFRRLLRRKLAEEKVTSFTILRGDKPMTIPIPMKD